MPGSTTVITVTEPGVSIRLGAGTRDTVKLDDVALAHHLGSAVRVDVPEFNGGNVLRLALATCMFNVIMKLAAERRITLTELAVSADGSLGGGPDPAPGFSCDVTIAGDATGDQLRELVTLAETSSPVSVALPPGIPVHPGRVRIAGG